MGCWCGGGNPRSYGPEISEATEYSRLLLGCPFLVNDLCCVRQRLCLHYIHLVSFRFGLGMVINPTGTPPPPIPEDHTKHITLTHDPIITPIPFANPVTNPLLQVYHYIHVPSQVFLRYPKTPSLGDQIELVEPVQYSKKESAHLLCMHGFMRWDGL